MARQRRVLFHRLQSLLAQLLQAWWRLRWGVLALITAMVCIGTVPSVATPPLTVLSQVSASTPATLDQEGRRLYEAQHYSNAIATLQHAIRAYEQQNNPLGLAMAYRNLALVYQAQGNWDAANGAIANALSQLQAVPSLEGRPALARVLDIQGAVQLRQGQTEQALSTWNQATDLYRQLGDESGAVRSQINQAQALQSLGFYRRAIALLIPMVETLQAQPASQTQVVALRNLGDALLAIGALEQSQTVLQESLAAAQELQLTEDVAATRFSLGKVAQAQGNTTQALDLYQQAEAETTMPLTQAQIALSRLNLRVDTQPQSVSPTEIERLVSQLQALPSSQAALYAQINLAQTWIKLADTGPISEDTYLQIAQWLTQTRQQAHEFGNLRVESFAIGTLAGLYERTQQWADSKTLTENALTLAQSVNAPDITYRWQWQLGRLLKAEGQTEEAIAAYSAALDSLQTLRSDLVAVSPEVQLSFQEGVEPVHRELVSLLLAPTEQETSQADLEKARTVIESLQLAELDNFFREACLDAMPVAVDDIDPEAAVIYPIILEDRLEVIVRLPQQALRHFATPVSGDRLQSTIIQLRQLLVTRTNRRFLPFSQQLYDWIIRPIAGDLAISQAKTLVFVLDGPLRNLPMATLHDGQRYLIEDYGLALTPGLQLLNTRPLAQTRLSVLIAGLTEARQGFPALPNVTEELDSIQTAVSSRTLLNQGFTEGELGKAIAARPDPILHLATHGVFGSTFEQTFILTWDNRIDITQLGGLLQISQGAPSNPVQLLVLSACKTATGDNLAALGLAGVAVRSGARSTLATLWNVSDEATAILMTEFYDHILQGTATKAEALRQAQLAILENPRFRRHPYYWAPYVLAGNWL